MEGCDNPSAGRGSETMEAYRAVGEAKVCKLDSKHGIVFGWAIVCKQNGELYFDLQDEHVPEDVMLEASLGLMSGARVAKEMHRKGSEHGEGIIFAVPLTEEICKAAGITCDKTGLFIGMKPSRDVFAKFASGEYTGFSIGGGAFYKDAEEPARKSDETEAEETEKGIWDEDQHPRAPDGKFGSGGESRAKPNIDDVEGPDDLPTFGSRAQAKAHADKHGGNPKFSSKHGGWVVEPRSKGQTEPNPINFGNPIGGRGNAFGKTAEHDSQTNAAILSTYLDDLGV